jgi:hypothetical protein
VPWRPFLQLIGKRADKIGISFSSLFHAPLGVGVRIMARDSLTASAQEVISMRRRKIYFLAVLAATALLILSGVAMPAPAKEETVTLSITGMT